MADPAAADCMREIEDALADRVGLDGTSLVREVVLGGLTIAQAARSRGCAISRREVGCWSWLFRRSLDVVALRLGYRAHGALSGVK